MSALAEFLAKPRKIGPRYIIDPVAFFIALVGGPLMFTAATFWLFFIPVFALGFGAIPYLVLGTPVLLFHLGRHPAQPSVIAGLALLTLFCVSSFLSLGAALIGNTDALGGLAFYLGFGIIFAPAWAACFGWMYGKLCRDFYAHPIPV